MDRRKETPRVGLAESQFNSPTMEFFDVQTKPCYVLARVRLRPGVAFANGFIQSFRLI